MQNFTFKVRIKQESGTSTSRRLRNANMLPAILYGKEKKNISITIDHDDFFNAMKKDGFYNSTINLEIENKMEQVKIKSLQRHPFKNIIMHADFIRV